MYGQGRELEIGNATSAVLILLLQTWLIRASSPTPKSAPSWPKLRAISDRTTTRPPLRERLA
jgi:hypothetical protein